MLVAGPEHASGSVVACAMEGTRRCQWRFRHWFTAKAWLPACPGRTAAGLDLYASTCWWQWRKRAGLPAVSYDALRKYCGGVGWMSRRLDLGIVMAMASSYKNSRCQRKALLFFPEKWTEQEMGHYHAGAEGRGGWEIGFKTVFSRKLSVKELEQVGRGIKVIGVQICKPGDDLL